MAYERGPRGDSGSDDIRRCLADLEADLHELAWALARQTIAAERERRLGEQRRDQRRGRRAPVRVAPVPPPQPAPVIQPETNGKRMRWTRDTVIAELCEWLISGIVEPAFLRRHGKPGLVTAATRIFGRFDSALNVANLYLAKQYPDGPPARRTPPATQVRAIAKRRSPAAPTHEPATLEADPAADAAPTDAALEPVPGDATIVHDEPPVAPRAQ
jgi:hypothetical protein